MSRKPQLTRKRNGRVEPNPKATAFGGRSGRRDASHKTVQTQLTGALQLGNSDNVKVANDIYLADIEAGHTAQGRYTRVYKAVMARVGCSEASAKRAVMDAKLMRAADYEARRPQMEAAVSEQLQRIADREEERDPMAAIAALNTISRLAGLFAPQRLEVADTRTEPLIELRGLLDMLPERGRQALDVVLECMAELEKAGRLLPVTTGPASEDIPDAEIVEPEAN